MNDQSQVQDDMDTIETDETQSGDDLAAQALSDANQSAVITPTAATPTASQAIGEALISLQNVIERNADELDRLKDELKEVRDSLKNVFENDTELNEVEEQVTAVTQKVKERKSKIQSSPEVLQYKTKIGEISEQKKEIEEALNNHLLNLYQMTGAKTFDTASGRQREFSIRASLKSRKGKQDE